MLDRVFVFFPEPEIAETPGDRGLQYEDVIFSTSDGVGLHGWFVPGKGDLTWVWFHGNAGNISHRLDNLILLHQHLGINIFIFDYRGYGRSEGSPSEKGMYLDAESALDYLRSKKGIDHSRIVLFGRSLGCAIAVEMALRHQTHAVILESPFTSLQDMARRSHPVLASLLPVGVLVRSRFDSLSKIKRIRSPIMIMHGDRDEIIPLDMGRTLFEAAGEPKRFYTIEGAGHNDTYLVSRGTYFEVLRSFLQDPADTGA